jgi:GDPmannose 4,6-dehydratase
MPPPHPERKALIIGVAGQDGAYLADLLLRQGYVVYGTSRDHEVSGFSSLRRLGIRDRVRTLTMVASDFRSVLSVLQRTEVDEIYNLAGQTSVGKSFEYPIETIESILTATINLLECLRLLGRPVRFYNAGSSEAYGNTPVPATELTPFAPRSPYATAKAAAHYAVANYREAYGLFACTGILFNHESPLRPERFVTSKIVRAAQRIAAGSGERLVLGRVDIERDWGWAPDYVEAMWKMLQQPEPRDFVIATGQRHSLRDFVAAAFHHHGLDWARFTESDPRLFRPTDIDTSCGDPSRASRELGWTPKHRFPEVIAQLCREIKPSA